MLTKKVQAGIQLQRDKDQKEERADGLNVQVLHWLLPGSVDVNSFFHCPSLCLPLNSDKI